MDEKARAVAAWTRGRHGHPRVEEIDLLDVWAVVSVVVGGLLVVARWWL